MDIQQQIDFLEELWTLDQKYRMDIINSGLTDPDAPEYRALVEKGEAQDAINLKNLIDFVNTYDWPRHSVHGDKGCEGAFLVIQHANETDQSVYLPMMRQRVQEDDMNPMYLAMLEDRYLMNTGQPQIYGSQARKKNSDDMFYVIWPVIEPSSINERRKQAGFARTVEEYAERMGATYIPDLKVSNLDI